jgi:isopentenyl diphosphate isomerase/L-lactate dehydrogenase-like FMN-dependent dehydrogenase
MNSDLASALSIADLGRLARRTLPRILFDYLEGGAEDECGLVRNTSAFAQHTFLPRYLRDVDSVQSRVTLLGRSFDQPFGIAPTGFAGLLRPGADLMRARAIGARDVRELDASFLMPPSMEASDVARS